MVLLLTACVNPDGMAFTALGNPCERMAQYAAAVKYYMCATSFPIVFVDNSGSDISGALAGCEAGRLECLSFDGNRDKQRGKGYGEAEIIRYALDHSVTLRRLPSARIAKITGRLQIVNLNTIYRVHKWLFPSETVFCAINSDLSFPDSRLIIGNSRFFKTFLPATDAIDDSAGYYFEHALIDTLRRDKSIAYSPFFVMPRVQGVSGSTGQVYDGARPTAGFMFSYARYALMQLRQFRKLYR